MSGVHDKIVRQALAVLPEEARTVFKPYNKELKKSSRYPDELADTSMSVKEKRQIDPEADRFTYPDPPRSAWYRKILKITEKEKEIGYVPLRDRYLIRYYLRNAVKSLNEGDVCSAVKFCGVYSHVIADMGEPIHTLNPGIVDMVVPPPKKYIGMELHANIEGLAAPVNIKGYKPKLLGKNFAQVEMNAYAELVRVNEIGRTYVVPIVQMLYAGKRKKAVSFSKIVQDESARISADFMYTVFWLHCNGQKSESCTLDLCTYPYVRADVDMLYRYKPMLDISLIPYSGGRYRPLALLKPDRSGIEKVHGLGVVPYLGPPFSKTHLREAYIEYFLIPGAFKTFCARVGCNPLFKDSISSVIFRVLGNDRELFRSRQIRPQDASVDIQVPIGKTRWLTLAMRYSSNPTYRDVKRLHVAWVTHGVWANPRLQK